MVLFVVFQVHTVVWLSYLNLLNISINHHAWWIISSSSCMGWCQVLKQLSHLLPWESRRTMPVLNQLWGPSKESHLPFVMDRHTWNRRDGETQIKRWFHNLVLILGDMLALKLDLSQMVEWENTAILWTQGRLSHPNEMMIHLVSTPLPPMNLS